MPAEVQVGRKDGWLLTTESGLPACYGRPPHRGGLLAFRRRLRALAPVPRPLRCARGSAVELRRGASAVGRFTPPRWPGSARFTPPRWPGSARFTPPRCTPGSARFTPPPCSLRPGPRVGCPVRVAVPARPRGPQASAARTPPAASLPFAPTQAIRPERRSGSAGRGSSGRSGPSARRGGRTSRRRRTARPASGSPRKFE